MNRLSQPRAYALVTAVIGLALFASATPSPLYGTYRELWGFSPAVMTLVYATYAFGVLASLLLYLRRTSQPRVERWQASEEEVLRVEGSIFFGACDYLQRLIQASQGRRLVLDARHVNFIDFAGAHMLQQEARRLAGEGRHLVLRHARPRVREELAKQIGEGAVLQVE